MNRVELSVIIVAYKNKDILTDCIDSIMENNDDPDKVEIIIVDNSPDYELYDYISSKYPQLLMIKSDNRGFGAGNNTGVKNSRGQYLLFLNPDTILIEPVFKFAISQFEKNPDLSTFGLSLLNKEKKKNYSFFFVDRFSVISALVIYLLNKFDIFIPSIMHIHGANLFVRREMFINAGMFDENIFMYQEEPDLAKRIKKRYPNSRTAYFKNKHIVHLEGSCSPGFEGECNTLRRLVVTEKYYCKKYGLSLQKRIKERVQILRIKMLIYKIINKNKYNEIKAYYDIYMEALDT